MIKRLAPVYRYVGVVALVGWSLFAATMLTSFRASEYASLHFWILTLAVIFSEFFPIRLPRGRTESVAISASGSFTFALLLTHGLGAAVLAFVVAGIIDDARHRKPLWKIAFNGAQYTLSMSAGWLVLSLLSDLPRPGGLFEIVELPAIMVAGVVFFTVNSLVTGVGIALAEGGKILQSLRANLALVTATDSLLLAFTPIIIAVADYSVWLLPLLGLPMVAVYKSASISLKNIELAKNLRSLYEATRLSYGERKLEDSMRSLLAQTCDMFGAEAANLILLKSGEHDSHLETSFHSAGDFRFLEPVELDPTRGVWSRVVAEETALLLTPETVTTKLRNDLEEEGIRESMVAPVRGSDGVIGILQVSNRVQGKTAFTEEELKLFETLANHAGVSVENAHLVTRLEESLAHLTEMNRLKDDFVASVSHELRTPLTSIKGYVQTLLRPGVRFSEEQQRDFLTTVARQADRLHRLIEDLLVVSRIETAATSATVSWVSIPSLLRDVLDELQGRTEQHPVEIVLEPDLPTVETDQGKLHQIIGNLVDNAMKYSEPGSPVTIRGRQDGDGIVLTVEDRGEGIKPEEQANIFDRFYQVDQSSTRKVGGAGLGLYICRSMAKSLDARIWLDRSDETGSVFALRVPIRFWDMPRDAEVETDSPRMGAIKLA